MGQVLYRKYRSKSLDEIIGQEHITTTLKNALKSGAISHAYLFTGPRGVGKTSIARILAHELNELPYTGEDMHLDIIEIDAASNRGIDEIRDLREKVNMAPSHGKYKVYIIDEVHMLTTPAFNALLKTLEEPPAHVVFILATTESHKLPETIVSRTQRYNFRPVEPAKVIDHLQYIAKQESLKASKDALALIAEHGEGSFRDSISLLNQAASRGDTIDVDLIQEILGLPPKQAIHDLFTHIKAGDKLALVQQLQTLHQQGYQASTIAKQLAGLTREAILRADGTGLNEDVAYSLLTQLINVPTSPAPERLLEIVILQACPRAVQAQPTNQPLPSSPKKVAPTDSVPVVVPPTTPEESKQPVQITPAKQDTAKDKGVKPAEPLAFELETIWPELLKAIKINHNTVYGILRMAVPELRSDQLTLTFKYAFHQKRLQEAKHRKIISDVVQQLTGQAIAIECRYDKDVSQDNLVGLETAEVATNLVSQSASAPIATISNIFGGGELLES